MGRQSTKLWGFVKNLPRRVRAFLPGYGSGHNLSQLENGQHSPSNTEPPQSTSELAPVVMPRALSTSDLSVEDDDWRCEIAIEVPGPYGSEPEQKFWALLDTGMNCNCIFRKKLEELHKTLLYTDKEPKMIRSFQGYANAIGYTYLHITFDSGLSNNSPRAHESFRARFEVLEDQGEQQLSNWDLVIGRPFLRAARLIPDSARVRRSDFIDYRHDNLVASGPGFQISSFEGLHSHVSDGVVSI